MKWSEIRPGDMVTIQGPNEWMNVEPFKNDVMFVLSVAPQVVDNNQVSVMIMVLMSRPHDLSMRPYLFGEKEINQTFNVYREGRLMSGQQPIERLTEAHSIH